MESITEREVDAELGWQEAMTHAIQPQNNQWQGSIAQVQATAISGSSTNLLSPILISHHAGVGAITFSYDSSSFLVRPPNAICDTGFLLAALRKCTTAKYLFCVTIMQELSFNRIQQSSSGPMDIRDTLHAKIGSGENAACRVYAGTGKE